MEPAEILVVDDEPSLRETLELHLRSEGHRVRCATSAEEALALLGEAPADVVVTDVRMRGLDGVELLRRIKELDPETEVIVMTAYARAEDAVAAMKVGAYDYLIKPFNLDEFSLLVARAVERRRLALENQRLRAALAEGRSEPDVVARSAAMQRVLALVDRVAAVDTTVLVTGESGVGKEVIARRLHAHSPRAHGPFVPVNCGAIPENLVEAELFGYERGAFTGADRARPGLVEQAHGGTLFLDEVGELPLAAQVKLLRVLQEQRVRRLGANNEIAVDVRFVAATNRDLEAAVAEGSFREDLYYRLDVIRIEIPPLRERPEDIEPLVRHFVARLSRRLGLPVDEIDPAVFAHLQRYAFPGNVRELENLVERAVILARDRRITPELFPVAAERSGTLGGLPVPGPGFDVEAYLTDVERELFVRALEAAGGVKTRAAELLGLSFRQFRYKAKKLGLS